MPRPRFQKLPEEKRQHILETAAKEFALHGYDGASLNQILEQAGMSKGAAYYYFDDKADVFVTTLTHYIGQMTDFMTLDPQTLTAENFWHILKDIYRQPFLRAYDQPWVPGLLRAANQLGLHSAEHPFLQEYIAPMMHLVTTIVHRGQALGVVRNDLPDDLLLALLIGFDDASDDWLMHHWDKWPKEQLEVIIERIADMLERIFAPPN